MRYRRLIDGEPQYGQGQQDFLQGIEAVAQAILTRLKLYTGEWWEDQNDGIPLWTQMLSTSGQGNDKFNAIISARILDTKLNDISLVSSISNVSNTWDSTTRKYSYGGTAKSIYGYINISNNSGG